MPPIGTRNNTLLLPGQLRYDVIDSAVRFGGRLQAVGCAPELLVSYVTACSNLRFDVVHADVATGRSQSLGFLHGIGCTFLVLGRAVDGFQFADSPDDQTVLCLDLQD